MWTPTVDISAYGLLLRSTCAERSRMSSEMTLVSRTIILRSSVEARRFAYRLSWRDIEGYAPERLEEFVNDGSEILGWSGLLAQDRPQNIPRFLLHGAAVPGSSNTKLPFQSFFEVADRNTGHIAFSLEQCKIM